MLSAVVTLLNNSGYESVLPCIIIVYETFRKSRTRVPDGTRPKGSSGWVSFCLCLSKKCQSELLFAVYSYLKSITFIFRRRGKSMVIIIFITE